MNGEATVELAPYVLAITDLEEGSIETLKWGNQLANNYHANLKVLYPYRFNQIKDRDNLALLKKKMEIEANNRFNAMAKRVFNNGSSQYDFEVEVGFINDRVNSFTRKNDVLMVVIGRELINNNKEALNEMVRDLQVPLLIVPPATESQRAVQKKAIRIKR